MENSFSRGETLKGGVMSGLEKVDLVSSHFFFFFYFLFNLFFYFLFLAPGVRVSNNIGHLT